MQGKSKAEVLAVSKKFMELHQEYWPGWEGTSELDEREEYTWSPEPHLHLPLRPRHSARVVHRHSPRTQKRSFDPASRSPSPQRSIRSIRASIRRIRIPALVVGASRAAVNPARHNWNKKGFADHANKHE